MKKQRGFSLIELLIVVAIILIIAAIAIPKLFDLCLARCKVTQLVNLEKLARRKYLASYY